MHRRQRYAVYQGGGDPVCQRIEPWTDIIAGEAEKEPLVMQPAVENIAIEGKLRLLAGIHHGVDKLLHRRLLDTVKVITHAHIENK